MDGAVRQSPLLWLFFLVYVIAFGAVAWLLWPVQRAIPRALRVTPVTFADLPRWPASDPRDALEAWRRSCAVFAKSSLGQPLEGAGYAGRVAQWLPACRATPPDTAPADAVRAYFENWFAPLAIGAGADTEGLFTGYYEPELHGSWRRIRRFQIPIYGLPDDLVVADLGRFRVDLAGQRIAGRLDGNRLVPYPARADIDAHGLPHATILLYTDDPIPVFFLHIQGSGRVRFADGSVMRLAYAGTNGRPYTPIGRVLVAHGAMELANVSLQTIRTWLRSHPHAARGVMETDQSYVFFSASPLGDPALGSPGTLGAPLTPTASLAVDGHLHPLGAPVYLDTTIPDADPAKPDHRFAKLLVAQDTGGAIRGAVRGDIFWGFGAVAETIAGRMKSRGRFYVLVPKQIAAALGPYKDFPGTSR